MEIYHRDFKGVWIPKEIWLAQNLSLIEKCLLVEIDSLDNNPEKGCFASNAFLSKFIGVSEGRCANIISSLKKRGYIFQVFFDGRNRGLRLTNQINSEIRVHESVKAEATNVLEHTPRIREHTNTVTKTGINTNKREGSPSDNLNNISFHKGKKREEDGRPANLDIKPTIVQRALNFKNEIKRTANLVPGKYSSELLTNFFDYWSAPLQSSKEQMLFESEKAWSTETRLKKWYNTEKNDDVKKASTKKSSTPFTIGQYINPYLTD
jgi:hypothetical protein